MLQLSSLGHDGIIMQQDMKLELPGAPIQLVPSSSWWILVVTTY